MNLEDRIAKLERRDAQKSTALWVLAFVVALLIGKVATGATPEDELAADQHRWRFFAREDFTRLQYVTIANLPEEMKGKVLASLRLVVPSLSLKPLIDDQLPQPVVGNPTLFYLDLTALGWEKSLPKVLMRDYPHGKRGYWPLVVQGDWLVQHISDASESTAHYELLYDGKIFKTREEFLKAHGVVTDKQHRFGMIEAKSGVAVAGKRWIEAFPQVGGYAWGTRDSRKIDRDHDPLERPDGTFKHDAEEWIFKIRKLSSRTGRRGDLQAYALFNGQGVRQDKAPVDIVEDHTKVRGAEIRNGVSCFVCHATGMNEPTLNELRDFIRRGGELFANKKAQSEIEAFHFSDMTKELGRNREDYQEMVEHATGLPSPDAAACIAATVKWYDKPVTLETIALDFGKTPAEVRLAIGRYELAYGAAGMQKLGARLADVVNGGEIPRDAYDSLGSHELLYEILNTKGR